MSDPAEASRRLAANLRARRLDGIVTVDTLDLLPKLVVYVARITPEVRAAIPSTWDGIPVDLLRCRPARPEPTR